MRRAQLIRAVFRRAGSGTAGGSGVDELVKVSAADTTEGFLDAKLVAGPGISLAILNPGADEDVEITATGAAVDELVAASAADTTPGFLAAKLVAGPGISLAILNPGADEDVEITATGGGGVLDHMEIYGDQLMIANNADWDLNVNAPTESDSNNNAWKVAAFIQDVTKGRGFRRRIHDDSLSIDMKFLLRGNGSVTDAAQFQIRFRKINPVPAAVVDAWASFSLNAFAIPANSFHAEFSQSVVIGGGVGEIDLDAGFWYQFELVRLNFGEGDYAGTVYVGGVIWDQMDT